MSAPRRELSRTRLAVAAGFFLQGLVFAAILTQIPGIQDKIGLGDGDVTVVSLIVAVLAGCGSVLAGVLAERGSSATAFGLALLTITVTQLDIPIAWSLGVIAIVALVVALTARPHFVGDFDAREVAIDVSGGDRVVRWRPVLVIGVAVLVFYASDTGILAWSRKYLHDALDASKSIAPLAFAAIGGAVGPGGVERGDRPAQHRQLPRQRTHRRGGHGWAIAVAFVIPLVLIPLVLVVAKSFRTADSTQLAAQG